MAHVPHTVLCTAMSCSWACDYVDSTSAAAHSAQARSFFSACSNSRQCQELACHVVHCMCILKYVSWLTVSCLFFGGCFFSPARLPAFTDSLNLNEKRRDLFAWPNSVRSCTFSQEFLQTCSSISTKWNYESCKNKQ